MTAGTRSRATARHPIVSVALADEESMAGVLDLATPNLRVTSVLLRPHTYKASQHIRDVTAALGRTGNLGQRSKHDDPEELIIALHTHRVQYLVVGHAQWVLGKHLEVLLEATLAAGATLVVVGLLDQAEPLRVLCDRWRGIELEWDELVSLLGVSTAPERPSGPTGQPDDTETSDVDLPTDEFPLFRFRCRELLDPAEFAEVDRLYCSTYRAIHRLGGDGDAVRDALVAELRADPTPSRVIVRLRATQAAAAATGLQVRGDHSTVIRSLAGLTDRTLTPAQWRSLRAYTQTYRAAVVALTALGLSAAAIRAVRVGDVDEDGRLREELLSATPQPVESQVYLAAHRLQRLLDGAALDDGYLTEYALGPVITKAQANLALPISAGHRRTESSKTWTDRAGISTRRLT